VANQSDSSSSVRAQALLAAAYLSFHEIGEDSISLDLYNIVKEEYSGSEFNEVARDIIKRIKGSKDDEEPEKEDAEIRDDYDDFYSELEDEERYEQQEKEVKIYEADNVDDLPRLMTNKSAIQNLTRTYYPFGSLSDNIRARVMVKFVVQSNGEITDMEIESENPEDKGFGNAAESVLKELEYNPGRRHGKRVAVYMKQEFVFEPF